MSKNEFMDKYITTMDEFVKMRELSRELTKNKGNKEISSIIQNTISLKRKQLESEARESFRFKWCWIKYKLFKITLDKK